jgi:hypothetical protein
MLVGFQRLTHPLHLHGLPDIDRLHDFFTATRKFWFFYLTFPRIPARRY